MSTVRILVLTSSTGGGHDARAQAFAEWCFELYRHQVDVRIEQMLEDSSAINRVGVDFYNWIQKKAPYLHTPYYTFVEALSYLNSSSVQLGAAYYRKIIQEYRPHLIFSVHDCLNRGYFQVARKLLGADAVRCATYCGEFSGGWGYSRNWIEPTVDLYVSRTRTANDYAVAKGVPAERSRIRGHFMRPISYAEVIPPADIGRFRHERLGLAPDRFTVFLATGGNGANNHLDLLPALVKHADRCQAIVICGRNREAYNHLVHWRANHPEFACYIEGYSEMVHLLTQASDAIVTRGGTTTCAQALHYRCPIIFNAFGGIMPQEQLTWKFFRNGAGSEKIETGGDFEAIIDRWMADRTAYPAARARFESLRYEEDPTTVIDELVGLANEAAKVRLERFPFPHPNGSTEPSI